MLGLRWIFSRHMHITRLLIENFRCIKKLDLDLCRTTVLIGPNNSGKTAILEAIRIALTRRWGQRGTGFTEYDIHLPNETTDPRTAGNVIIEVELEEAHENEWHEDLRADLTDIIQRSDDNRSSISMRVTCGWDSLSKSYVPQWTFLNSERRPMTGAGARATNLQEFFQYLPAFYLDALRDAESEYSPRSQFWGRLLREIQIPENLQQRAKRVFDLLNEKLLNADPKLGQIVANLENMHQVVRGDEVPEVDVRATPMRPWDLLSRSEVICRAGSDKPWFPLSRQGQGTQSLSVMFLFKAFVTQLIATLYRPASEPVLALEEPETHLHPQAARSLWRQIADLPGQKIISTHSPYFLQHVPFRDIRIVRMSDQGSEVRALRTEFREEIPSNPALQAVIQNHPDLLSYDTGAGHLVVSGRLSLEIYREILTAFGQDQRRATIEPVLRRLKDTSAEYVSDDELVQLETFARRIRGEIFFARRWLLIEGQCEYLLSHALGNAVGYSLDENGVSVIDCQNNGYPQIFAVLARALGIPWFAVFDGDQEGTGFTESIRGRDFSPPEMNLRCSNLAGTLEQQLIADGVQAELRGCLTSAGISTANITNDVELLEKLTANKIGYARELVLRINSDQALATRILAPIRNAIQNLRQAQ
jgi:putative ATP-dependent endonuclease of OLD family